MSDAALPSTERRFRRILLGLDPSSDDPAALARTAALAERLGAAIRGLFVEDEGLLTLADNPAVRIVSTVTASSFQVDRTTFERSRRGRVTASRRDVARVMAARRVTAVFEVRQGSVVDELIAAARDADLIVLGWGSRGLGRRHPGHPARPGSVACAVAERARVPVLLMLSSSPDHGPVFAAYDGSAVAGRALQAAFELAPPHAEVIVGLQSDRPSKAEAWQRAIAGAHGAEVRFLQLPRDDPAALVAAARQVGAALLAIGISDGECCGGPLRGLLDSAGCSVLLIH